MQNKRRKKGVATMIAVLKSYYLLFKNETNPERKELLKEKILFIIEDILHSDYKELENDPDWLEIYQYFCDR